MRHGKIYREDILLLYIDLMDSKDIDIARISGRFKIKENTTLKYFREMVKSGAIRYNRNDIGISIRLTDLGEKKLKSVREIISKTVLEQPKSGFAYKVPLQMVLDHLEAPYDIIEFLDRFYLKREAVATSLIDDIKAMRNDSIFSGYFKEVLSIKGNTDIHSLEMALRSSSIYTVSPQDDRLSGSLSHSDIDCLLLKAEVMKRTGSPADAKCIYDGLLQRRHGLETSRWLLCASGSIQCMIYLNRESEGMELLEQLMDIVENPIEKGFLKKVKADIIQGLGRFEEAANLYRSCLGLFHVRDFPVIRASALNNLGVMYFRKNDLATATSLWEEAYNIVMKEGLKWCVVMTSINLADAYSLEGNIKKAMRLLGKARTFLQDVGDFEGISEVDFNMALVQIEKGDFKRALKYFEEAERYPLTYKRKSEERKIVFEGRMRDKRL